MPEAPRLAAPIAGPVTRRASTESCDSRELDVWLVAEGAGGGTLCLTPSSREVRVPQARVTETAVDIKDQVISWRVGELRRAGYDERSALLLALAVEIDLHIAVGLLRKSCPPELAVRILL